MRYKLTRKFKKFIRNNQKIILLKDKGLKWTLKNLIYKNISIHQNQLMQIYSILKINQKQFSLKKINLQKEINLGRYSQPQKIDFKKVNKQFAEFIGILLGDGNIYKNNIRIMIDKREEQYKYYIKNLINNLFKISFNEHKEENSNQLTLYKHNKNLVQLLINHGLKRGNKIKNKITIPIWIKKNNDFAAFCLKGLIDTDGCVYRCKRDKKVYIKFTSASLKLLNGAKDLAKQLDINFAKAGKNNICLYNQREIAKYINKIGFSNSKHINKLGL